jgi:Family of unknown function (DUF6518)
VSLEKATTPHTYTVSPKKDVAGPRPVKRLILAALAGLAVGLLTLFSHWILPGSWNQIVTSGAVWLLAAFLAGSARPVYRRTAYRWAAAGGLVVLVSALGGYSLVAVLLGDVAHALLFWGGVAMVGGPVFGAAGQAWRSQDIRRRVVGLALLGAAFASQGWQMISYKQDPLAGWMTIGIGLVLTILLARSMKERLYSLLGLLPLTGLAMGVVYRMIR